MPDMSYLSAGSCGTVEVDMSGTTFEVLLVLWSIVLRQIYLRRRSSQ